MSGTRAPPGSILLVAVLVLALVAGAPALAGDNTAIMYVEQDGIEADPGETVTVDVVLSSHGGYGGDGVGEVAFALEYDADALTVVDVEHGEWLAAGDADVVASTDHETEAGTLAVSQRREPPGDGATGTEPVVTLTVEVAADADPADSTLEFTESTVGLVNDYPQTVVDRDATILVAGGETPEGSAEGDDDANVTLADDASSSDSPPESSDDAADPGEEDADGDDAEDDAGEDGTSGDDAGTDSTPGFTAGAALAAGFAAAALVARRAR